MRVGPSIGLTVGPQVGPVPPSSAALPYSTDAASGKAVPASSAEWSAFISAAGLSVSAPSYLHLCQEASGNLADTIGGLTLTANGSPAYQQAVAGWTRLGVKGDALTANQRFRNITAPNPSTTSMAMFAYVAVGALDATVRSVLGFGAISDTNVSAYVNAAPVVSRFKYRESANISDTSTAIDYAGLVVPMMLLVDHTGTRARFYTNQERLSPTYGLPSTATTYFLGADAGTWAATTILYSCGWTGAAAEISDANVKALFTALGYSPPWS